MIKITDKNGFTLIELSIVLVIIGLVVGGVLVGRDLIRSSEIRGTITQQEKYNTAVNTFSSKYNCLPGDCATATDVGLSTNGDGDGFIGQCSAATACKYPTDKTGENVAFWQHLSSANLINDAIGVQWLLGGPAAKIPALGSGSSGAGWMVIADAPFDSTFGGNTFKAHSLILTLASSITSISSGYSAADAFAIDSKIDDGIPVSGNVKAPPWFSVDIAGGAGQGRYIFGASIYAGHALSSIAGGFLGAGGGNFCVRNDVTPYAYNIQSPGTTSIGLCNIIIKASF